MKKIFLFTVCVMLFAVSCDNEAKTNFPTPPAQELQDATYAIDHIIGMYSNYDMDAANTMLTHRYWYCDVLAAYSGEWASLVLNDFGGEPWISNYEPIMQFQGIGFGKRYTINAATHRVVEAGQNDMWSFDAEARTLKIRADKIEQYGALDIDATLLAIAEDVMVLKWTDRNDVEWRAVYRVFNREPHAIEADLLINATLEEISDYDSTTIEQSIVGKWEANTYVEYDSEWQHVTSPMVVFGMAYSDGISLGIYTFNEDATFNLFVETEYPLDEDLSYDGVWSFDPDSRRLSLEAEGFNREYTIVGYGEELIFADNVYGDKNYREGLIRVE